MSAHFQSWTASKDIKLEPSILYHLQTYDPLEIANKEILQVARACKEQENSRLSKILKIQLRLNSPYNTSRRNSPFAIDLGFDTKLELDPFPYTIYCY